MRGFLWGVCLRTWLGMLLALKWEQCEGQASAGTSETGVGTEACSHGTSQAS